MPEYRLPGGTRLAALYSGSNLDKAELGPDPEAFRPQRWVGEDGKALTVSNFMPFSTGKRQCIGSPMARVELFLLLGCLLQAFRIRAEDPGHPPSDAPIAGLVHLPGPFRLRFSAAA